MEWCVCEREHVNLGLPTVCLCVIHHYMNTVIHASSIFILLWIIMIAYHLYTNQLSCYSLHILLSLGSCQRVVLTILASSVNAIPSSYLLINLDGWWLIGHQAHIFLQFIYIFCRYLRFVFCSFNFHLNSCTLKMHASLNMSRCFIIFDLSGNDNHAKKIIYHIYKDLLRCRSA